MSQQITSRGLPDTSTFLTNIISYITSDSDCPVNSRQHAEKEQTFMNLMEANALGNRFTFEELLEIAYRTKCFVVAQFILEKLKRYEKIIECFVMGRSNHELFRYIMEYKNNDERKIYSQIFQHFQAMLEMDCEKTTKLIIEYYPICIPQFLKKISAIPKLNYNFLNALIANSLPLEVDDYNKFLVLQSQYNPENVLEFLQNSNHSYDVQHAMSVVAEKNLSAAMIFLYEKSGQHQKAFTLAMDLLKEAPESQSESCALKVGYLCMRASQVITQDEKEAFWFELIEVILSKNSLSSIVKQVLHLASSSVDPNKLVQLIMKNEGNGRNKNFGDIKHIVIGLLSNFEYESLLLKTSQNILGRDLHKKLLKQKQSAEVGIYCKSLKCVICKRNLSDSIKTSADEKDDESDKIIVLSLCGHSMHNSCYQDKRNNSSEPATDEAIDFSGFNSIQCHQCGLKTIEKESVYLKKTNWNLIPVIESTTELQLKVPARV